MRVYDPFLQMQSEDDNMRARMCMCVCTLILLQQSSTQILHHLFLLLQMEHWGS